MQVDRKVQPEEPALAAGVVTDVIKAVRAQADLSFGPRRCPRLEIECALFLRYGLLPSRVKEQLLRDLPSLWRIMVSILLCVTK